jgi:hypothetical protein
MAEWLPSILLMAVANPLDQIVGFTLDQFLVNDLLYFEFLAVSLVKH